MYSEKFKEFIEDVLKEALEGSDLEGAFKIISEALVKRYEGTKVYFAEKFTTRIGYITGSGEESCKSAEKIQLNYKYFVFFQNFEKVPKEDKDMIISLCKIVLLLKEN